MVKKKHSKSSCDLTHKGQTFGDYPPKPHDLDYRHLQIQGQGQGKIKIIFVLFHQTSGKIHKNVRVGSDIVYCKGWLEDRKLVRP